MVQQRDHVHLAEPGQLAQGLVHEHAAPMHWWANGIGRNEQHAQPLRFRLHPCEAVPKITAQRPEERFRIAHRRQAPGSPPGADGLLQLQEGAPAGDDSASRANAAREIRLALEQNKLDLGTFLAHVAGGDSESFRALAWRWQLDHTLLETLAQLALKPVLHAWQKQLTPLTYGIEWRKGYCFICGAGATLAELQGNDQVKHLRCGQCGADWIFRRLQCMYCGNDNPKMLSYFHLDKQKDLTRVEVCENCKGYLKVVPSFSPEPLELLIVQDLATLPLDYIAKERGYARVAIR